MGKPIFDFRDPIELSLIVLWFSVAGGLLFVHYTLG